MKNKELFIGAIALLVIFFLYKFITERNNNNVSNKVDLGKFPVPQTTTISQKLTKGLKNFSKGIISDVDDSPKQIIRNRGGNLNPLYSEKDYLKPDILSANPIGSTEFSFVDEDPEKAYTETNVSQHPKYHRSKFNDYFTDPGKFFKDNEFHDKTSPNSENHLPDRCFLNNGEVVCSFNDRLQNIPPKLIMNTKENKVLNSIGELNKAYASLENNDEFYKGVSGALEDNNEINLDISNLPKGIKYSF